jgi:hypothetical protein
MQVGRPFRFECGYYIFVCLVLICLLKGSGLVGVLCLVCMRFEHDLANKILRMLEGGNYWKSICSDMRGPVICSFMCRQGLLVCITHCALFSVWFSSPNILVVTFDVHAFLLSSHIIVVWYEGRTFLVCRSLVVDNGGFVSNYNLSSRNQLQVMFEWCC